MIKSLKQLQINHLHLLRIRLRIRHLMDIQVITLTEEAHTNLLVAIKRGIINNRNNKENHNSHPSHKVNQIR